MYIVEVHSLNIVHSISKECGNYNMILLVPEKIALLVVIYTVIRF